MPAKRIGSQLIPHQSVQPFETLAHVHRFHRNVDLGRQPQTKHATQLSATRISFSRSFAMKFQELSMRRPLANTSAKPPLACGCVSIATSTSFGRLFFSTRRQESNVAIPMLCFAEYSLRVTPLSAKPATMFRIS